jgi:hypothetical protein
MLQGLGSPFAGVRTAGLGSQEKSSQRFAIEARPEAAKLAATTGTVTMTRAIVTVSEALPAIGSLIGHQAPVSPGLSGGPLLAGGRMIGLTINVAAHEDPAPAINISFATTGDG